MVSKYTPLKDRLSAADEVDKEWSTLTLYRDIALGGAAILLAFGGAIQSFLVNVLQKKDVSSIGEVLVKLFFVVLFFLWYQSGNEEYKILKKWVRTPTLRPQKPIIIMFSIIGLGVFFGLLTTFAAKIHVVFLMFCLYLMGDVYTWILRRGEIGAAIEGALRFFKQAVPSCESLIESEELAHDQFVAERYCRAIEVIRSYYFSRRHISRIAVTLLMVFILFIISYASHLLLTGSGGSLNEFITVSKIHDELLFSLLEGLRMPVNLLRIGAYCSFIVVLTGSELILHSWRKDMRNKLYDINDELVQYDLSPPTPLTNDDEKTKNTATQGPNQKGL